METGSPIDYRVYGEGWLPGWAAVVLFAVAAGFALWQLRREFRGRPTALTGWVLPMLRLLIVGILCWLLAQPVLVRLQRTSAKPRLLIVVDSASSMATREAFANLADKLDTLSLLDGQPIPGRDDRCSQLGRQLRPLRHLLRDTADDLQAQLDQIDMALPLSPDLPNRLTRLATAIQLQLDPLQSAELPAVAGDPEAPLPLAIGALHRQRTMLAGALQVLVNDAAVTGQEAGRHPQVLSDYLGRLRETIAVADRFGEAALAAQTLLDEAALPAAVLAEQRQRTLTRGDLARLAAGRLEARFAATYTVDIREAAGLDAMVQLAEDEHFASPLAAVMAIGDGSRGDGEGDAPVAVHSLLVGTSGEVPADAGIATVDLPPLAVVNDPFTIRVLVKHQLAADRRPTLRVRHGEQVLHERSLDGEQRGLLPIDIALTLSDPGHAELTVELLLDDDDAFPGNERLVRPLQVLPATARVLLVGSRIDDRLAAWHALLGQVPQVSHRAVLAAPEVGSFEMGDEPGTFPATAADWREVELALLIGDVPDALREESGAAALEGLREAVASGLHVLVHDDGGDASWSRALGVETAPLPAPVRLRAPDDGWRYLAHLGADAALAQAAWQQLPPVANARRLAVEATPLIVADDSAVVGRLAQGDGQLLYLGIPSLALLRAGDRQATISRLLTGILAEAIAPVPAGDRDPYTLADFQLTPDAAPLAALAARTGGVAGTLAEVDTWAPAAGLAGPTSTVVTSTRLWTGFWPLVLLLLLGSGEYLLRRRAGRVM